VDERRVAGQHLVHPETLAERMLDDLAGQLRDQLGASLDATVPPEQDRQVEAGGKTVLPAIRRSARRPL
jgi:hypothetical protein